MKKDWAKYLLALIFILVLIPLGVAFMLSFRFIITDTTNEWIGFWGGYLGAIIGGVITLYVMWKTNVESRNNLKITLDAEKELERQKEKQEFSYLLVTKLANWAENIDDMITKSAVYLAFCEKTQETESRTDDKILQEREYMLSFSRQLLSAKSNNYELYLHFKIKKDQNDFAPILAKELYELFGNMHDELKIYYEGVLAKKYTSEAVGKELEKINTMISTIVSKSNEYIKSISQE